MSSPPGALPTWLREVNNALVIAPHVVITGNVLDFHLVGNRPVRTVPQALWSVLEPAGYEFLLVYHPLEPLEVMSNREDAWATAATLLDFEVDDGSAPLRASLPDCLRSVQQRSVQPTQERRVALAVEQASRLLGDTSSPTTASLRDFQLAEHLSTTTIPVSLDGASLYNVCFWIARDEHDLPDWFASTHPRVRILAVPSPTPADRRVLVEQLWPREDEGEEADLEARNSLLRSAVDSTAGLPLRAVEEITQLTLRQGDDLAGFPTAALAYRVGLADSPWDHEDTRERVRDGEEKLRGRVLGQEAAIRRSLDILKRSVTGLTGAHASGSSHPPRGVLFFAGPTGVGKTELAKALTELVFGNEDRYVRFDMSEFKGEHTAARLIGAPPGYVGFDAGGELTNALRRQPFSLVLFDEIEKAHPLILDNFLQILDEGRLTDGRGGTVYFSEAILVFTTNKGMDAVLDDGSEVKPDTPHELMEKAVRERLEEFFIETLERPELYNRIGDNNIVVFRFITPEIADEIFSLALARVTATVEAAQSVTLVLSDAAREAIRQHAVADLSMGGRRIGSRLEEALTDPLARRIFEEPPEHGGTLRVESARMTELGWELETR